MEIILCPLVIALLKALLGNKINKWIMSVLSIATLGLVIKVYFEQVVALNSGVWQTVFDKPWFSDSIRFTLGFDGVTYLLLLLTSILTPIVISSVSYNRHKFIIPLILVMQSALNGVFMAKDGLMFYILWELALIPIYFITLLYSHKDAYITTIRFFIFTFLGSLAMLASLIYLYLKTGSTSFSYEALINIQLSLKEAILVGGGFLLAFAVKIPLVPFHIWQADTYTNAPAQGSMMLSGVMLKMALYGLIRWYMPLCGESISYFQPAIMVMAVFGVVYGAIIALKQNDMKRLIAYSSLSHVGLITAGLFSLTLSGFEGGMLQMFTHGINVVGLFFVIEIIEYHYKSRDLSQLGGLAKHHKLFTILYFVVVLGSLAAPLTNGFPGELMLLKSIFDYNSLTGIVAGLTIILCAVYMLRMFQLSMLGESEIVMNKIDTVKLMPLFIISAIVVYIGLNPQSLIDVIHPSIQHIMEDIANSKGVLS